MEKSGFFFVNATIYFGKLQENVILKIPVKNIDIL